MSEAVGPGHPPRACRFKKGQSGNPTGRPKRQPGAESPSAFDIIVDKTLTVIRNGAPCELTVAEALQHKTYQDALAGNRPARRAILKMVAKREKALQATGNRKGPNVEIRLQSDPHNADEALVILGIACRDRSTHEHDPRYDRLWLEPWAVQMALSRRGGGQRLTPKEVAEIKRCTRNADTLRWPRGAGE